MIDEGRLPRVGPADDGHPDRTIAIGLPGVDILVGLVLGLFIRLRHQHPQRIVEFAEALAMLGRNLHGVAKPERVGLHRAELAVLALALVRQQHHRLVGAARQIGKTAVGGGQPQAGIDDKQQGIGGLDCRFGLLLHPCGQRTAWALVEAGGVDDGEFQVAEPPFALAAIAGHARLIVDQREPLADQPVEQRRFADIRPADDRECVARGHGAGRHG